LRLYSLSAFPPAVAGSGFLLSFKRLQLRGSGGFSPHFPLPDGEVISEGENKVKAMPPLAKFLKGI
jgi:hypothetical protein